MTYRCIKPLCDSLQCVACNCAVPADVYAVLVSGRDAIDAERYRWLRDGADDGQWECFDSKWLSKHDVYGQGPTELDAAIDAARQGA